MKLDNRAVIVVNVSWN